MSRGSALLRPSRVRGSAFARRGGGGWSPEPSDLDPLLAEAVMLLRASAYSGSGDWLNEGTAGGDASGGRFTRFSGEKHWWHTGAKAQVTSCPDAADLDLSSGFVVVADVDCDYRRMDGGNDKLLARPTDGNTGPGDTDVCYSCGWSQDEGYPFVEWRTAGGQEYRSFNSDPIASDAGRIQFAWEFVGDNGAGGWTARIYWADGGTDATTPDGVGLTLIEEIVDTGDGAQTIVGSSEGLFIGFPAEEAVYRVRLYDSMGGDLLRDFYPDRDYTSGLTMTSGGPEAEVWTSAGAIPVTRPSMVGAWSVADDPAFDVDPSSGDSLTVAFFGWAFDASGSTFTTLAYKGTTEAWTLGLYDALGAGGVGLALEAGSPTAFVTMASPSDGAEFVAVLRFDGTADELGLFTDGTEAGSPGDLSSVGDLTNSEPVVVNNALDAQSCQVFAAVMWARALTDTEITVNLPAALGL